MKAYFITYQWKRAGEVNGNPENLLTKEFPIRWLIDHRTKYNNISYTLLCFQELELTEAEFKNYADNL